MEFFASWHLIQLVERIIFKKKFVQNGRDLPFKFCKIGLKNTLFIFGRKNGRLLLLFVVAIFCPILAYFFFKLKLSSS